MRSSIEIALATQSVCLMSLFVIAFFQNMKIKELTQFLMGIAQTARERAAAVDTRLRYCLDSIDTINQEIISLKENLDVSVQEREKDLNKLTNQLKDLEMGTPRKGVSDFEEYLTSAQRMYEQLYKTKPEGGSGE